MRFYGFNFISAYIYISNLKRSPQNRFAFLAGMQSYYTILIINGFYYFFNAIFTIQ